MSDRHSLRVKDPDDMTAAELRRYDEERADMNESLVESQAREIDRLNEIIMRYWSRDSRDERIVYGGVDEDPLAVTTQFTLGLGEGRGQFTVKGLEATLRRALRNGGVSEEITSTFGIVHVQVLDGGDTVWEL